MKLDNKGFAISGILYSILVLFLTLIVGILTVLGTTKFSFDKVKNDILENIENNAKIFFDYSNYDVNAGTVSSINYLEGVFVLSNGETLETEITYEIPSNFSLSTPGTYQITYSATVNGKQLTAQRTVRVQTINATTYSYTGEKQEFLVTQPGLYKLETWGAQGGYRNSSSYGGKGGYSTGVINLKKNDKLYLYVGGAGGNGTAGCGSNICSGGFNGGGYRYKYYGGGGASDIRINDDSTYSRVIVAGGGGSDGATSKKGMYGGGTTGGSSTDNYSAVSNYGGKGGTQTFSGYSKNYTIENQTTTGLNTNTLANYAGGFGFGGGGVYLRSGYGGAGGGGWYGGSGNVPDNSNDNDRGGGGGSGWIYTESTYNAWADANTSEANNWLLDDTYYLTDASTVNGNSSMPNPTSSGNILGNTGNGYIKVTPHLIKY